MAVYSGLQPLSCKINVPFVLWMILVASATTSVDLTGMPPQIEELRAIAAAHKLSVLCVGKEGEAQVIRVGAAATIDQAEARKLLEEFRARASEVNAVDAAEFASGKCDHVSPESHAEGPPFGEAKLHVAAHDMAFGPRERLAPLLQRAVSCGFAGAQIRPLDDIDREYFGRARNAPSIKPGWLVLDAGEPPANRYQPLQCYMAYFRQH
jgi:hypothetical protein